MQAPIKTQEELEALLERVDSMREPLKYRAMLMLSFKLGLRPIELARLETNWFSGNALRIPIGRSKRGVGRTIPVNDEITQAVLAYVGMRRGTVFLNALDMPYTAQGISDAMRRVYREAGQRGSCYSGRRTMATTLVRKRVNIAVISKILGHSSIATTQNYIGVSEDLMRDALFA